MTTSYLNIDEKGANSKDPDNCKHNWPEYTTNENGDEINECPVCNVSFFGFYSRYKCYVCAYIGTITVKKVKL